LKAGNGEAWAAKIIRLYHLRIAQVGSCGIITTKFMADLLRAKGIPEDDVGHYGAIAGLNRFERHDAILIVGRKLVPPAHFVRSASVATGMQMMEEIPRPVKVKRPLWFKDGSLKIVKTEGYQGEYLDEAYVATVIAQLTQAEGRPRGIRRPGNVTIIAGVFNDRPVDATITLSDVEAAAGDFAMLLASGLWAERSNAGLAALLNASASARNKDSNNDRYFGQPLIKTIIGSARNKEFTPSSVDNAKKLSASDGYERITGHLIKSIDVAFKNDEGSIDILGIPLDLSNFHPVKLTGFAQRSPTFRIRADNQQAAEQLLLELLRPAFPNLAIKHERKGRGRNTPT
jgi:hypothetical protein